MMLVASITIFGLNELFKLSLIVYTIISGRFLKWAKSLNFESIYAVLLFVRFKALHIRDELVDESNDTGCSTIEFIAEGLCRNAQMLALTLYFSMYVSQIGLVDSNILSIAITSALLLLALKNIVLSKNMSKVVLIFIRLLINDIPWFYDLSNFL
jgi:hypothetical protein